MGQQTEREAVYAKLVLSHEKLKALHAVQAKKRSKSLPGQKPVATALRAYKGLTVCMFFKDGQWAICTEPGADTEAYYSTPLLITSHEEAARAMLRDIRSQIAQRSLEDV